MAEPLIRYKDVEVHQQDLCVLNEVNLELQKGEFVYLIGKVGSVGEEAVETVIEACNGTDERLIYEGADLIYHLIVLLTSKGYSLEDLARELQERHSASWKKH